MSASTTRQITGVLLKPDAAPFANSTLTIYRHRPEVVGQGDATIVPEVVRTQTGPGGEVSFGLVPGNYLGRVHLSEGDRLFYFGVPDGPGPFDIADLIDESVAAGKILTIYETMLAARAWARNPEDQPVAPGEFSALHWAKKSAAYGKEWAQSPDPISSEAGGDGVTDRSSKYWAGIAGQLAEEVAQQVENVTPTVMRFSGDGVETEFDTGTGISDIRLTNVFVDGVYQQKDTYAVVNGKIVFDTPPAAGTDNIEVVLSPTTAQAFAIPSNGTVSPEKTTWIFEKFADIAGANIPDDVLQIETLYAEFPGDSGGAIYKRVAVEPDHDDKIQSADGSWWEKVPTFLHVSQRNISSGYTPVYDLANGNLSVQYMFDMGDITLPSGASKQHNVMRFTGTARNYDNFETSGARYITFNMNSHNADAYGVIGSVTLKSGAKEVKAIYGRAALESEDGGVGVGLVGGVTIDENSAAAEAWALQLTIDGDGDIPNLAGQRFISLGTNSTFKNVGYGIFADPKLRFSSAFIRAFNGGYGPFLRWQEPDSGSGHIDLFRVENTGHARGVAGSIGAPTWSFVDDPNTGIYNPGPDQLGISAGTVQVALFRQPPSTDTTSLVLRVNRNGSVSTATVSVGPENSGGTGYRVLRVPN
jgi:hypothetical protein